MEAKTMKAKDPNRYPTGLNKKKVQAIIDHYESLDAAGWERELAAAKPVEDVTWVRVPSRRVSEVMKVLAKPAKARKRRTAA
jgi:hypothetical protein